MIPQGFACCGLPLGDKTRRVWLHRSFSLAFIPSSDDVLTSSSKRRWYFMNRICVGQGRLRLKKSGVNVPPLMFWRLSFMTSLWPCLRSTTLTCSQWARSPLPRPPFFFFHHYSPAFFFFFSHTHAQRWGEKNDLSAAHNSLHFYRPEWSCSTKGDIIFSGFDWPPPCHRMTSCKTAPPTPPPSK